MAIGVLPHLTQQLRDGALCAPFGREAIANRGMFFIVPRRDAAERDSVKAFVGWLRAEARRDGDLTLASSTLAKRGRGARVSSASLRRPAQRS